MSDNHPTTTRIDSVCVVLGDDHDMTAVAYRSGPWGSVSIGQPRVHIDGTPAQLRSLAAALIAGAGDIEDVLAERTDRDMEAAR